MKWLCLVALVLCACSEPAPRQGTAQSVAAAQQATLQVAMGQASSLHEQSASAAIVAAALRAEATELRAQGKDASQASLEAARAEGRAAAIREAAAAADRREAAIREATERATMEAAKEVARQAEEVRQARVRTWCDIIGGACAGVGLLAGVILWRVTLNFRFAALVASVFLILAVAAPLYGASLAWIETVAPYALSAFVLIVVGLVVWLVTHSGSLQTIIRAPTVQQLPDGLRKLAAKHGWTT